MKKNYSGNTGRNSASNSNRSKQQDFGKPGIMYRVFPLIARRAAGLTKATCICYDCEDETIETEEALG
jgi:hypothetical protein